MIRADASAQIGTGHLMRCIALAQAWRRAGGGVWFVCCEIPLALENRLRAERFGLRKLQVERGSKEDAVRAVAMAQELGAMWVVADGYCFCVDYQLSIKEAGLRLLVIDDYGHTDHYHADLVLNQNLSARAELYAGRDAYTRLLLGTRYVMLREEFLEYRGGRRDIPLVARKVLMTLGGSDPDNVTGKVVEALRGLNVEARIVVGGTNPHIERLRAGIGNLKNSELIVDATNMPELMVWADIAVAAGGSTCWELAFVGLPSLVLVLGEDQSKIATALQKHGVAENLGWAYQVSEERIQQTLEGLLTDANRRREMSASGRRMVDGAGAQRVAEALREIEP